MCVACCAHLHGIFITTLYVLAILFSPQIIDLFPLYSYFYDSSSNTLRVINVNS